MTTSTLPSSPLAPASIPKDAQDTRTSQPCLEMLKAFASIGSDQQREVYLHWIKHSEIQHCVKLDQLPDKARELVEAALADHPPRSKLCHDNAWRLAMYDDRISIETGWANSIIPMEHSWCSVECDGVRYAFDPTDLMLFEGKGFTDHVSLAHVSAQEARYWAVNTSHSGPYLQEITSIALGWHTKEYYEERTRREDESAEESDFSENGFEEAPKRHQKAGSKKPKMSKSRF